MPTRQGWLVFAGAVLSLAVARVFAVRELYVIATSLALVAGLAVLAVRIFRPRVHAQRATNTDVLVVGDSARMTVRVAPAGHWSPSHELVEPVGHGNQARLGIGRLDNPSSVAYAIPTERRGLVPIGPLIAVRRDLLGLAQSRTTLAPQIELAVAPRALPIEMPHVGRARLGRHLAMLALRLGLDDFYGLRDYVPGDELRSIHWKASARSDDLMVKEYDRVGLSRCVVVLDLQPGTPADESFEPFETAATAAASILVSADSAGLTTRFVSSSGIDLRGPNATLHALDYLARAEPLPGAHPVPIDRDPGEGLGLVVVITPEGSGPIWRVAGALLEPGMATVGVLTTADAGHRPTERFEVISRDESSFLRNWCELVGARPPSVDLPASPPSTTAAVTAEVPA